MSSVIEASVRYKEARAPGHQRAAGDKLSGRQCVRIFVGLSSESGRACGATAAKPQGTSEAKVVDRDVFAVVAPAPKKVQIAALCAPV